MKKIIILGTGSYVPPKVLANADLQKMGLDTTDEWITQRTGVRERRIADPGVTTSDLALRGLHEGPRDGRAQARAIWI